MPQYSDDDDTLDHRRTSVHSGSSGASTGKLTQDKSIELTTLGPDAVELKPFVHDGDDYNVDEYNDEYDSDGDGSKSIFVDDGHGGPPPGSASNSQVVVNICISFVGAGLLGVPDAFQQAGWVLGSITLVAVAGLNLYAMLLLPQVKRSLQAQGYDDICGYGDLGRCIMGPKGERFVQFCLGISQAGFGTAYLIFISANLWSIAKVPRALVCGLCVPGLAGLVQFREMKSLAPFSLLANGANACALLAVLFQDYESYTPHNDTIHQVKWDGFLYVIAITIYSMEGVGLILSLQSSCKQPSQFPLLLRSVITCISGFMAFFGAAGYWAFGNQTQAPITLNLAGHWSSTFVKLALCLGLYLTYPIMMFPIWAISERLYPILGESAKYRVSFRCGLVCVSAFVGYAVPDFGKFLSLVGSSICTILGFILPCYFHIKTHTNVAVWQYILNVFLMVGGGIFGILGTYQSFVAMFEGEEALEEGEV
jgi:proton-coupled amino acid transporter